MFCCYPLPHSTGDLFSHREKAMDYTRIRKELQISKMALLCVGNSELKQHCSEEKSEEEK